MTNLKLNAIVYATEALQLTDKLNRVFKLDKASCSALSLAEEILSIAFGEKLAREAIDLCTDYDEHTVVGLKEALSMLKAGERSMYATSLKRCRTIRQRGVLLDAVRTGCTPDSKADRRILTTLIQRGLAYRCKETGRVWVVTDEQHRTASSLGG